MKPNSPKTALFIAGLFILSACGGARDVDKIADAQNCLDKAVESEAAACVAKVDGIDSEAADLIRCTGKFVKEGFNSSTKLSGAISNLSGGNTGAAGSVTLMASLAF